MEKITETHITVAIVTMVIVNVGRETNIPVTLMHERRKAKLMGLKLSKYIELRKNGAITQRKQSLISMTALFYL